MDEIIYVRRLSESGYGVFAKQLINKDQIIGEYTGVIKKKKFKSFSLEYISEIPEIGSLMIDAEYEGNLLRFVNNCDTTNVRIVYLV